MTIELRPRDRAGGTEPRRPGPAGVAAARLLLFLERAWPALLPMLAPIAALALAALFGVFALIPTVLHWAALAAAAAATAIIARRHAREIVWPTRREALARLEQDGLVRHAPLQALEDRPFGSAENPLWRAHLDDMETRARSARLKGLRATADARDPFALRFGAVGLLAVALVAAGPERDARLAGLFSPSAHLKGGVAAADLWIEPPAYTGKAPVFLLRAGERLSGTRAQIDAPQGSLIVAQSGEGRALKLSFAAPGDTIDAARDGGRSEIALAESGVVRLRIAGVEGRWPVGVVADAPPSAEFIEPPAASDDARLALALTVADDYAIAGAALHMKLDPDQARPLDAPSLDEASVRAERIVELDGLAGKSGERRFDLDLQADPWAGLAVIGRLIVRDGAGQTGATAPATFTLPARPFFNPLARAVVEQRQTLAVAPGDWRRAGRSFDALTFAPDSFYESATDYLLIRTAFWRVMREGEEAVFDESVSAFWPLALQLEDEALELARRRLEAAQDALRAALEQGAGADEIARLVEELREAMRQYLAALAASGQSLAEEGGQSGETLNEGDLESMLDSIRDLAQSGAENAARQALSDLENLLNNLRLSQSGGGGQGEGQPGQGANGGAAGEAGDLIGRQRDLANRSFERGQSPGSPGDDLASEEGGISDDLQKLLGRLGEEGAKLDPNGEAGDAFGDALSEMERAESALRGGDFDAANTAMEQAIDNLRTGAEALAETESEQARQGRERDGRGPGVDPLGRPLGDPSGRGVEVPDGAESRSARDVLEELRRRLSDGKRSEEEIDYLERLLERF